LCLSCFGNGNGYPFLFFLVSPLGKSDDMEETEFHRLFCNLCGVQLAAASEERKKRISAQEFGDVGGKKNSVTVAKINGPDSSLVGCRVTISSRCPSHFPLFLSLSLSPLPN